MPEGGRGRDSPAAPEPRDSAEPSWGDGLLNDWNVAHFHLSTAPHPPDPRFLDRTGDVLLAYVTPSAFHLVRVQPHKLWHLGDIIEVVHENWPDLFQTFRAPPGVGADRFTDGERRNLRQRNGNAVSVTRDGTCYLVPGRGSAGGGPSFTARGLADWWDYSIDQLERGLQAESVSVRQAFSAAGSPLPNEAVLRLQFRDDGTPPLTHEGSRTSIRIAPDTLEPLPMIRPRVGTLA